MGRPRVKGDLHESPSFRGFFEEHGDGKLYRVSIHSAAWAWDEYAILEKSGAKIRRMTAWQERLESLRSRVEQVAAECDRKYGASQRLLTPDSLSPNENAALGAEVETPFGRHLESEKLYPGHQRHGSADIGALSDLPHDLLRQLSGGTIAAVPPGEWAFLDTETTGLGSGDSGASGTCAFLVGVGRITQEGFRVRQFFMRNHGEEASLLDALARHLRPFRVLVTYNGRAFDQPLLEARYRWNRAPAPFPALEHLDLLHGARRLWKLRFESCRLVDLENQVLGFEREGDIPGALIPYVYYEYTRTRQAARLLPVFEHNALDILSLACLTAIVPEAFNGDGGATLRHASEMTGVARWLRSAGDFEGARDLLRRAVQASGHAALPDGLLYHAMWDLALLERRLDAREEARALWEDLAQSSASYPFQVRAIEELAKHYEHRTKDREQALAWTRAGRAIEDSPELTKREARLTRAGKVRTPAAARSPRKMRCSP
jgi:uncharacterized protein YprB with RNaseH-like and TPR domain